MKKALAFLLTAVLAISSVSCGNRSKKNLVPENASSDVCGDDLTWRFDEATSTLYIEGKGDMWDFVEWDEEADDYSSVDTPWSDYSRDITNIEIADGVTSIGDSAFTNCYALENIDIPDSVTSIGDEAFSSCGSLTSIDIPDSVTSIGNWAFANCTYLTSIDIPDRAPSIVDEVLSWCDSLTNIGIPGKTSIGVGAFSDCICLTSIDIPNGVTYIKGLTFANCYSLTSIDIPDSVNYIEDLAFARCFSLETINFAGTEEQWDDFILNSDDINDATVTFAK